MKKVSIILKGGIGNQLFQYSISKYLKKLNPNLDISFDTSFFETKISSGVLQRKFYLSNLINEEIKIKNLKKKSFLPEYFCSYFLKKKMILSNIFDGYWQDIFFAKEVSTHDFKEGLFKNILEVKNYSVIHVRLTDFKYSKAHFLLNEYYYSTAIKEIKTNPIICLSDDIDGAKDLLKNIKREIYFKKYNEFDSFALIFNATQGIASNSTFCWWPIFLSKNKKWIFPSKLLKNTEFKNSKIFLKDVKIINT